MRNSGDFINLLGEDISLKIFICLDDPSDLARATAVSKFWRRFVIENRLCKQLCLRISPDISRVVDVVKLSDKPITESKLNVGIPKMVVKEHEVYSHLACGLTSFAEEDCIAFAISASSTTIYPDESIENTTLATNGNDGRPRHWSSEGVSDPTVPETLFYKLTSNLCLVSEIHIQPFQAYSSKTVRFHLGHLKLSPFATSDDMDFEQNRFPNGMFVLPYTSPEFPMDKTANIQKFKLPKPVLCIGGILKIELLGRVQKKEMDGLYYICLSKVQVVGRPLSPPFDVDIFEKSGRCILKYYFLSKENRELPEASIWRSFSYM